MSNGGNLVQNRTMASKIIEKHKLDKVFELRFPKIRKPYKTNGKSTFIEIENATRKPYKNKCQMEEI